MSWLVFLFAFEAGLMPNDSVTLYDGSRVLGNVHAENSNTYAILETEAIMWNVLFIGTSIDTRQTPETLKVWVPYRIIYSIWAGVRFSYFELGIHHYCDHPIIGSTPRADFENLMIRGSQTRMYFRFEISTGKDKQ